MKQKKASKHSHTLGMGLILGIFGAIVVSVLLIVAMVTTTDSLDPRSQAAGVFRLLPSRCNTAQITDLSIREVDNNVVLNWLAQDRSKVVVYRSSTPYFQREQATIIGKSTNGTFIDKNSTLNNVNENSFYAVARECPRQTTQLSNQVGEWEWDFSSIRKGGNAEFAMPFVVTDSSIQSVVGDQLRGGSTQFLSDEVYYIHGNNPQSLEAAWYCKDPTCEQYGVGDTGAWLTRTNEPSKIKLVANDAYRFKMHSGEYPSTGILTLMGAVAPPDRQFFQKLQPDFLGAAHTMIPLDKTELQMASDVLSVTPGALYVFKYDAATNNYVTYFPNQPGTDFAVYPGMPIWITLQPTATQNQLLRELN